MPNSFSEDKLQSDAFELHSENIISCTSVQNVKNLNVMQSTVRVLCNLGISV